MKTEFECRLLDVDVESFINKLKKFNAKFIGDWLQIRNCYDFNPKKENSWIRLRTNGKETTLTIKEINNSNIDGPKTNRIQSTADTARTGISIQSATSITAETTQSNSSPNRQSMPI